jgi:hypothetical protein
MDKAREVGRDQVMSGKVRGLDISLKIKKMWAHFMQRRT